MTLKKILYIHHGQGLGGAPLSLLYLVEGLDKRLYKPVVLFLKDSEVVDLYKSRGIEVVGPIHLNDFSHTKVWWYRWYHPHHLISAIYGFIKTFWVARYWLKKINPDLVHLNTSSLVAWAWVSKLLNIPVAFHVREPLASGYLGIRKNFIRVGVGQFSDLILPICKNDAAPWKDKEKTHVLYNAVDPSIFDHQVQPMILDSGPKILFLGGLSKEKGTLVILKVFKKLVKKLPSAKLVIAGYFDKDESFSFRPKEIYKREVLSTLKEIEKNVIFLGAIRDVPSAMAGSDVIVSPFTQGHFARPIIEAGFMKKPVVASNLPPLDELIIDGKTGFLVDVDNIDLWASKLETLLNDESMRNTVGENAYSYCREKFTVDTQISILQKHYQKIMQ